MEIDNIRKFLATSYSDEKLAALLAHAESGRLSYSSCCCLIGIPTANHALHGAEQMVYNPSSHVHLSRKTLPFAREAEEEFYRLADDRKDDRQRRKRLLPLIREEMERREIGDHRRAETGRVIGA